MTSRESGFTLIELLVALAIAALISIGTLFLFNVSFASKDIVDNQSTVMAEINRALRVIEQDIIQLSPYRSVRNAYAEYQPAIQFDSDGLFITRNGWANSKLLSYERSSQQRVHYRIAEPGSELCEWSEEDSIDDEGGCLIRSYTVHLDDDGSLSWQHQQLLRPVKKIEWQFLVFDPELQSSSFSDEPPVEDPRDGIQKTRLMAISALFHTGYGRQYYRIFRTPSQPSIENAGVVGP